MKVSAEIKCSQAIMLNLYHKMVSNSNKKMLGVFAKALGAPVYCAYCRRKVVMPCCTKAPFITCIQSQLLTEFGKPFQKTMCSVKG